MRLHWTPESAQRTLLHSCMNKAFEPHRGATRKATLASTLHWCNFEPVNWFPLQWHWDFVRQRSPLASLAHPDPHPLPHRRPDRGQMRQRAGHHDSTRRSIMDEGKVFALLYVATCQRIICPTPCSPYGILLKPRWGPRRAQCGTEHRSMIPAVSRLYPLQRTTYLPFFLCAYWHHTLVLWPQADPPCKLTSFLSHHAPSHEAHIPIILRTCAGVLARLGVTGAILRSNLHKMNSVPPPASAPTTSTARFRRTVITDHLSPPRQFLPPSPPVCKSPATGLPDPSHLPPVRHPANPPFPLPP